MQEKNERVHETWRPNGLSMSRPEFYDLIHDIQEGEGIFTVSERMYQVLGNQEDGYGLRELGSSKIYTPDEIYLMFADAGDKQEASMQAESQAESFAGREAEFSGEGAAEAVVGLGAQEAAGEAVASLAIHEAEARGENHSQAVHEIAMKAEAMLEKTHEELAGIPSPKHELPAQAEGVSSMVKTEVFGEVSVVDRKKVIESIFSVNRELRMLDGEIRKLKSENASEDDIRKLTNNASAVRRDINKLIKAGTPNVYRNFAKKHPEMVGTSKERAMVLREFIETHREEVGSQRKADTIFEGAVAEVEAARNASKPSIEMQAVEDRIDATVNAESGPEAVSDDQLVLEFKQEGIVPPDDAPSIEEAPEYNADTREAINARALAMQAEMDALVEESIARGDHHHELEIGGSVPHRTEDLNFGPAIAPDAVSAVAAASYTTSGYIPSRVSYKDVEVSNEALGDWSNFATRGTQYRSVATHLSAVPVVEAPKTEVAPVPVPKTESAPSQVSAPQTVEEKLVAAAREARRLVREAPAAPKENIGTDVYDRFDMTLGLTREILDSDPSFKKLTHEQQLLVLRDVASFSVDDVNQEAKKAMMREWPEQGKFAAISNVGKKMLALVMGSKAPLTNRGMRAEIAQQALIGKGEAAQKRAIFLRDIARRRLEQNPSISVEADGSLRVNLVNPESAKSMEDKEVLERYNHAAAVWARIPEHVRRVGAADMNSPVTGGITARFFSRRVAGLTSAEQVQYESARAMMEEAEGEYSNFLRRESGDVFDERSRDQIEKDISKELLSKRDQIATEQFFGSHPDAEAQILRAANPPLWTETVGVILRDAPKHMAVGAITRIGAVAALTALGAPAAAVVAPLVAAAGVSGFMARKSELAKAKSMLKERRASGVTSEEDLREKDVIIINNARNLKRKQDELREAVLEQDHAKIERLQKEVAEQEKRIAEGGNTVRVTRELREFRDAKHFSARVERLLAAHQDATELAESGDAEAGKRAELIESKLAKTVALMRAYKDQGMINYKRGYVDVSHAQGYADFAEAISKAEIAVSVDSDALDSDIYEKLVAGRSEQISAAAEKRMAREVRNGVLLRMGFAVAGSLIGMEAREYFGHGSFGHATAADSHTAPKGPSLSDEELNEAIYGKGNSPKVGESLSAQETVVLPDEVTKASGIADRKAAWEWEHAGPEERLRIEKVTGKDPGTISGDYAAANALGEYKVDHGKLVEIVPYGTSESTAIATEAAPKVSTETAQVAKPNIAEQTPTRPAIVHGSSHAAHAATHAPLHVESSHGSHVVARGETLSSVMRNMSEMKELSPDAREIAIADFVKFATPEQLKAVGISNANTLAEGQRIDVEKLGEALRNTTYRGTPLLEHAAKLAGGNPTEAHAVGSHGWTKPDESAFEKLIHRVAGGNEPTSHVSVAKDEAAFEALIEKVSASSSEVAGAIKLSPEMAVKVKESVDNVFSVFPDNGQHLRGMRAEDVLHKTSPYRWSSVSMNSEYNAMQTWMRDVRLKTHIEPKPGESVEQYLSDIYEKLHEAQALPKEASREMMTADFKAEEAVAKVATEYGLAGESLGFETAYVDQNHIIFQHKTVETFLKEGPGHVGAVNVNTRDYFQLQSRIISLTSRIPVLPKETVSDYIHRITRPGVSSPKNSGTIENNLF